MIKVAVAIVGTVVGVVFTLISYAPKEKIRVTACCTRTTLLAPLPEVPELTIHMRYKDIASIENLWKISYTLKNTGNRNIIGEGSHSSLVTKGLTLHMENVKQVFKMSVTNHELAALKDTTLCFKQWRPGESIIIEALVESKGKNPGLYIDGRDIVNAEVIIQE